jgi:hypothetical protein
VRPAAAPRCDPSGPAPPHPYPPGPTHLPLPSNEHVCEPSELTPHPGPNNKTPTPSPHPTQSRVRTHRYELVDHEPGKRLVLSGVSEHHTQLDTFAFMPDRNDPNMTVRPRPRQGRPLGLAALAGGCPNAAGQGALVTFARISPPSCNLGFLKAASPKGEPSRRRAEEAKSLTWVAAKQEHTGKHLVLQSHATVAAPPSLSPPDRALHLQRPVAQLARRVAARRRE